MIRVAIPYHLRNLAGVDAEVELDVEPAASLGSVLDALEARYPVLRGTIRDHVTRQRRPFLRFFACGVDISHDLPDRPLPDAVRSGAEPLFIIGAIAGGIGEPAAGSTAPVGSVDELDGQVLLPGVGARTHGSPVPGPS